MSTEGMTLMERLVKTLNTRPPRSRHEPLFVTRDEALRIHEEAGMKTNIAIYYAKGTDGKINEVHNFAFFRGVKLRVQGNEAKTA